MAYELAFKPDVSDSRFSSGLNDKLKTNSKLVLMRMAFCFHSITDMGLHLIHNSASNSPWR